MKGNIGAFICVLLIILALFIYIPMYLSTETTIDITIDDKWVKYQNNKQKYLIASEFETFENVDTLLFMKFDSSDVYRQLKVGETYKVKVVGWRIGLFSSYRNIIKIVSK